MKPIIEDFVNRSDQLTFLWDMARQKVEPRILVVEAEDGMGKTYLLQEFRAECQDEGFEVVCLDFGERYEDPGYLYVIKETWSQLGPVGFDTLAKTIEETVARSIKKTAQAGWQDVQSVRQTNSALASEITSQSRQISSAGESLTTGEPPGNQSGGVNIYGGTNTFRDVAGRDIVHFIQVIHHDDPFVQIQARSFINEAFKECLVQITAERNIIFFIDHWQKAEPDTRNWLAHSLVKWTADKLLSRVCVVIAGDKVVGLEPRSLLKRILLPELAHDAIQVYLVDICGLQPEDVPKFIEIAGGRPDILSIAVKRRKLLKRQ